VIKKYKAIEGNCRQERQKIIQNGKYQMTNEYPNLKLKTPKRVMDDECDDPFPFHLFSVTPFRCCKQLSMKGVK